MTNFQVGQKVVCVDASNSDGKHWMGDAPVEGVIYTICAIRHPRWNEGGPLVLHLCELERGPSAKADYGDDVGYGSRRFRAIVERKTDISIFREILNNAPTKKERVLVTSPESKP